MDTFAKFEQGNLNSGNASESIALVSRKLHQQHLKPPFVLINWDSLPTNKVELSLKRSILHKMFKGLSKCEYHKMLFFTTQLVDFHQLTGLNNLNTHSLGDETFGRFFKSGSG